MIDSQKFYVWKHALPIFFTSFKAILKGANIWKEEIEHPLLLKNNVATPI